MKKLTKTLFMAMAVAGITISCEGVAPSAGEEHAEFGTPLTEQEIQAGILTPEVMWKMGRASSAVLSPDGSQLVYAVTYYNMEKNSGRTSLYLMNPDTGESRCLTDGKADYTDPSWSTDGKAIYCMSDRGGSNQLWTLNIATGAISRMSDVDGGIEGYGISPSGDKAFYVVSVKVEKRESKDIYPDMDKSEALIYDDLMERHWNYWDRGSYLHIFVADLNKGRFGEGNDIMPGEPWDAPLAPYFDYHEIAWSPAGDKLAYTCKKLTGAEYAVSTDSDIYVYDLASGHTRNLTEGMAGYDKYPVFSPDGTKIAFASQERPGNEADKARLFVMDADGGNKSYVTRDFDHNAWNVIWDGNDALWFGSEIDGGKQICRATLGATPVVSALTAGDHDINAFTVAGGKAVCEMTKISMAAELFAVNLQDGELRQVSEVNGEIYKHITMGNVMKRFVRTSDGEQMLTWVVLPPDFDPTKKYPALLYCEGGPQSPLTQFWSFRWNFQLMATQGYIVVCPNRRGTLSHGQKWVDQISGDYSGQNIRDLLAGIDDVAKEPWCDETRMGCIGASYGGYSSFYLMGNHEGRFKAFIAHCGIFDFVSMYGHTEELFFVNNDYGGPYWSDSPVAKRSYANSPHMFVKKWDTPILIITGLRDFRIPYTQSLEAFTAARLNDIPARLVAFENEAHQVFQPQNSLTWNREFFGWLDKYVK